MALDRGVVSAAGEPHNGILPIVSMAAVDGPVDVLVLGKVPGVHERQHSTGLAAANVDLSLVVAAPSVHSTGGLQPHHCCRQPWLDNFCVRARSEETSWVVIVASLSRAKSFEEATVSIYGWKWHAAILDVEECA